jgi:hypothetical protein
MKHILNNLTEEEKNSIREQHTGGMKVMTENFNKLTNSKLGDLKPLTEQTEPTQLQQNVDLKKITSILTSLGFKNAPSSGYKFRMDKPNDGPVKDNNGNYASSYEAYIPLKQNSGFGYTDGKTQQLWLDKRGGLKPGKDEPNTYNFIFDLNPNNLTLQKVINGKVLEKTKITLEDFYNTLQSYK